LPSLVMPRYSVQKNINYCTIKYLWTSIDNGRKYRYVFEAKIKILFIIIIIFMFSTEI